MNKEADVNGLGIASLIVGIVSFIIFPIFLGALAIVFGVISNGAEKNGLATAGIILGIISIVWGVLLIGMLV